VRPVLATSLAALVLAAPALASEPLSDVGISAPRLQVNARGEALVTYRRADGRVRRVLVWGAVNARHPSADGQQVRFRYDYAGGWGKYRRLYWRTFRDACRPYDGPRLAFLVAACRAPDGSYWAIQAWRRNLPHRGHPPWTATQAVREFRVSHWTGEPAKLEAWTDWAFRGEAHGLFGRLTYGGVPVHGFSTTRGGAPLDRYGRNLYIDTFGSAYGPGWRRETSIVFRRPSGAFCYSFWPTRDVSLPGHPNNLRPAGKGRRYRITVAGPGVTPDVVWEGKGLPDFDPRNPAHVEHERRMNELLLQVTAPDRFCPSQL
jgi:hypothetical protein